MSKQFDKVLEDATNAHNIETDWSSIMSCVDMIRGHEISAKDAASKISKRLASTNPHTVDHTVVLLDTCMKNCGSQFHSYVFSSSFLTVLAELIMRPQNFTLTKATQEKLLEMIQSWCRAFSSNRKYHDLGQLYEMIKARGFSFPPVNENEIMFTSQCAPDWVDGTECYRCRLEFNLIRRKHHCRACGQIFCGSCSSQSIELPQFGIERKVRVCDSCLLKETKKQEERVNTTEKLVDEQRQRELQKEEEELQLALALSRSEAESRPAALSEAAISTGISAKESLASMVMPAVSDTTSIYRGSAAKSMVSDDSIDSRLAHYLDRSYWEKTLEERGLCDLPSNHKSVSSTPTLGVAAPATANNVTGRCGTRDAKEDDTMNLLVAKDNVSLANTGYDSSIADVNDEDAEIDATRRFCEKLRETYDTMDNRMRSNLMRGRPISNDTAIHKLFASLVEMHGDVTKRLYQFDTERTELEHLQDLCSQIHDCRQAVNALREENERARQEALLKAQRMRQEKMQQTLAVMRIKKQETLLHQRRIALERFQEHEKLMQLRGNDTDPRP